MKNNHTSPQHPYRYPGVQPFMTGQANVFFGRDNDIVDLYRLIRREPLVVLYGKSGLGKSSLLNAGIVPKCQETGDFNPVTIRFGAWTEGITDTPLSITKNIISEGYDGETFLDRLLPNDDSLWYHAKTRQLNSSDGQNGAQLLVMFDQFEELFTYPAEAIEAFKEEVAELLHTGIPLRFRRMADEADFLTDEDEDRLEEPLEVRQLFGIRSDRMHLMHQLADRLPNILRSMFELKALQTEDAKDAIILPAKAAGDFRTPPFEWTPAALASLLAFLQDAENGGRVEGILLQLLCQYFEEKMVEGAGLTRLDATDLGKLEEIVEKYYFEKIASIGDEETQMAARRLIEEGLVLEGENIRLSLHESQIRRQYDVDTPLLERLVNSRLLRSEPFLRGGYSYELAHDRLVPPVLAAKQQRRAAEAEKERSEKERELAEARRKAEEEHRLREKAERGQRRANIFTIVAVAGLLVAGWGMYAANEANKIAEQEKAAAIGSDNLAQLRADEADKAKEIAEKEKAAAIESDNEAKAQATKAEQERKKAQAALTNLEAANINLVREFLAKAKQDVAANRFEEAVENIKSASNLGVLKPDVAKAYLDLVTSLVDANRFEEALENIKSAANFGVSKPDVAKAYLDLVTSILAKAKQDVFNLKYEEALSSLKIAANIDLLKPDVANAYLEIAFWHGEAGNTQRATVLLDSAAALVNKKVDTRQSFRKTFEGYDPSVYKKMMERYYPVMVPVEGGTFDMGCDTTLNQSCESDESLHQQTVGSFKMAKYETTCWQYYLFCKATDHEYKSTGWGTDGDNPAVNVSWYDAVAYCNWVSRQLGEQEAIKKDSDDNYQVNLRAGYRLPTEAEWEFAAKGGASRDTFIYSGSNELDSVAWYRSNSGDRKKPVGTKKANALGLHDMSGNVWEWCWDWYAAYLEKPGADYKGAKDGEYRVLRGGSWVDNDGLCRVSFRSWDYPDNRNDVIGFRLTRVP